MAERLGIISKVSLLIFYILYTCVCAHVCEKEKERHLASGNYHDWYQIQPGDLEPSKVRGHMGYSQQQWFGTLTSAFGAHPSHLVGRQS